jgi:hypothetical protein
MPATVLTITAVDHTADTITIGGGHNLTTGDGFIAVYSPDGGTLPGGLGPVTDYWAIRISDTVLKLAASSSDAMANVPIPLSSNGGGGTLQLLRGLPYRRPRIAANLQQVFSDDLNQVWLSLVALFNLLTGQTQDIWDTVRIGEPVIINDDLAVGGDLAVTGATTLAGALSVGAGPLVLAGTLTTPNLPSGNTNDWNPTGLATAIHLRTVAAAPAAVVTGIAGGVAGRVLSLFNVGVESITLANESGSSTAANRFRLAAGTVVVPADNSVTLWYDGTSSRWRVLA